MAKATGKKVTSGVAAATPPKATTKKADAAKAAVTNGGATAVAAPKATRGRGGKAASGAGSLEVVMNVTHDQIAQKAYEIWLAKGCPNGLDEENWNEAEAALAGTGR